MVKGHDIYEARLTPMIGEELPVQSEDDSDHEKRAVAVMRDVRTARHEYQIGLVVVSPSNRGGGRNLKLEGRNFINN